MNPALSIHPVRVYYEDTDAGGVVYHASYLRFMERARTEWLRHQGVGQEQFVRDTGLLFVVRRIEIDYLRPGRLDDLLEVRSHLASQRRTSVIFGQDIVRVADGETITQAQVVIVCMDAEKGRPRPFPLEIIGQVNGSD
jgi:acyl-CoA thioester hydrolase